MIYDDFLKMKLGQEELMLCYLPLARDLMFQPTEIVEAVTTKLRKSIEVYARRKSTIYARHEVIKMLSKEDLQNKGEWFVPGVDFMPLTTSGTTSGVMFSHGCWGKVYNDIERLHYGEALREFGLEDSPVILHMLFQHNMKTTQKSPVNVLSSPKSPIHSHGSHTATTHMVVASPDTMDQGEYFSKLFEYTSQHEIDVLLASGPFINSLSYYARKMKPQRKLCKLVSNTCEPLLKTDVLYLKEAGLIDDWCDHMRCWDGGASFFTCRHGTYHLMDNLTYCRSLSGKLLSTDYFSLAAPYVNYWNGDYADIDDRYERCRCGRAYRPFQFNTARTFSYSGLNSKTIKDRLVATEIDCIKYVKCHNRKIEIVTERELTELERNKMRRSLPEMKAVMFTTELLG